MNQQFDVLVIGGGINGSGIALDATARGLKVAVVEMQDFASGSSSRSSKLFHGTQVDLREGNIKRATELAKENSILVENGPHITQPIQMLVPFDKHSNLKKWTTRIGLSMLERAASLPKQDHQHFSKQATKQKEPLLNQDQLLGSRYDIAYATDDARLTLEVLKKAVQLGATALNYLKVIQLIYDAHGTIIGVEVEDQITGDTGVISARKVVNATGPWLDDWQELAKEGNRFVLTKSLHLVFDRSTFPIQQAICFTHTDGNRIVAIPREGKVHVGPSEVCYGVHEVGYPGIDEADMIYLLEAINAAFSEVNLSKNDIVSSWVGLRSSIFRNKKKPYKPLEKEEIMLHSSSGLISIPTVEMNGFRKSAEIIVDHLVKQFKDEKGILYSSSETKSIPIAGGEVGGSQGFATFKQQQLQQTKDIPIDEATKERYIDRYGKNVEKIWTYYHQYQQSAQNYQVDTLLFAELNYTLEEECIYMPLDFFERRTGAIHFHSEVIKRNSDGVIAYLRDKLKWNTEETAYYKRELQLACH